MSTKITTTKLWVYNERKKGFKVHQIRKIYISTLFTVFSDAAKYLPKPQEETAETSDIFVSRYNHDSQSRKRHYVPRIVSTCKSIPYGYPIHECTYIVLTHIQESHVRDAFINTLSIFLHFHLYIFRRNHTKIFLET